MATLTIVFDLDGTLVDTAPDLIDSLNVLFAREGLETVRFDEARNLIGGGVRLLIERGLALQGRTCAPTEIDRLFNDYVAYYAEHIADRSRPFPGLLTPPFFSPNQFYDLKVDNTGDAVEDITFDNPGGDANYQIVIARAGTTPTTPVANKLRYLAIDDSGGRPAAPSALAGTVSSGSARACRGPPPGSRGSWPAPWSAR